VSLIAKEIEDPGCGYQITGWMGMSEWLEWCIEAYFHTGLSISVFGI
jgi:hypothetical protein